MNSCYCFTFDMQGKTLYLERGHYLPPAGHRYRAVTASYLNSNCGHGRGKGEANFLSPIPKTSQSRKPVFTNAYVRKAGGKSAGHCKS